MYFVTICTNNHKHYFGEIVDGTVYLSPLGHVTKDCWLMIPAHFPFVDLDEFIVMPNHLHGIICIDDVETQHAASLQNNQMIPTKTFYHLKPRSLSVIIRSFKSIVTKHIHRQFPMINFAWQSRFYDHVIRNEEELIRVRQYIIENPLKWDVKKID